MRQNKDKIKKLTSDVIQNMIRSNYLQTDDMKTVIYNSDIGPDYLSTVNYNSDVNIDDVSDTETINCDTTNKSSMAQQQAKIIIKRYRNLKRKAPLKNNYVTNIRKKDNSNADVVFIKQVPVHVGAGT